MLTIRIAAPSDAELIAEMSRQTFYDTFAAHNTKENMDLFMNASFTTEILIKEVGATGNIFLLAYDDNELVGYARMRENNNPPQLGDLPSIEIARIYSATSSIGKGVGRLLMQHCIDMAKERNKKVVWLGVWEKNQRAIDFYIKWGFEKFGDHLFILGHDRQRDWLMKKIID
ncbi:MAG TPA: GNAT family N-acetyltransferase [Chitinophagaceae bacterium]|jgi:ribosomal protein S18 acetylase RimI-like enzyme|nr:GNAT family N-acetyltransferase [Chitinophagaceae bacterium]